jgi:hypothetical protein
MSSRMFRDDAPLPFRRTGRDFPYLGTNIQPATPATRARFFATAQMLRIVDGDDAGVRLEGGPFHAKQMGTLLTACGLNAHSWVKAWEVPFSATLTPVCLECAAIARYLTRGHVEGPAPS